MLDVPHRAALGRPFALVLWAKNATGEDDVAVYSGDLIERDGTIYFQRSQGDLPIDAEWLPRITEVTPDLRDTLLGGEYQLSLTVGEVTDEESQDWLRLGLKWPD